MPVLEVRDVPISTGEPRPSGSTQIISLVLRLVASGTAIYFVYKYVTKVLDVLDPTKKQKKLSEEKAQKLLRQLGKKDIKQLNLTEYELNIAAQLVVPKELPVSWKHIGGLDGIISQIKETVILPFQKHDYFKQCKLFMPPKGILLFGPPGCGKTMIAKATAKEAGCTFINIEVQQLTDKWYGESQKLAAAVFSLAYKLQPSIIFIDEIDVFLQMRSERDHEVTAMMKATFMSLWDGLASDGDNQIMVMGATNRPQHIDQAILRRMPIRLNVPMPDATQREHILKIVLEVERVSADVDYETIAESLVNFSGSDIREMCRHASVARVHEAIKSGEIDRYIRKTSSRRESEDAQEGIENLSVSERVDEQVRRVSSTGEWEDAQEGKKSVSFANRVDEKVRKVSSTGEWEDAQEGKRIVSVSQRTSGIALRPINTTDLMAAAAVVQRSKCSELPGFPFLSNDTKK